LRLLEGNSTTFDNRLQQREKIFAASCDPAGITVQRIEAIPAFGL
jgi:hypothetical protein